VIRVSLRRLFTINAALAFDRVVTHRFDISAFELQPPPLGHITDSTAEARLLNPESIRDWLLADLVFARCKRGRRVQDNQAPGRLYPYELDKEVTHCGRG
jgi:hypothetical protein